MDRLLQGGDGHSGRGVTAMSRLDWLDKATANIYFRLDRKAVRRVLEARFEDLREASGLEDEAAVEAVGTPPPPRRSWDGCTSPGWGTYGG